MKGDASVILVVDDNPADVMLMGEALAECAANVTMHATSDGHEALRFLRCEQEHARAPRPSLVLLDINMPRIDGFEVLQAVRADRDLAELPVIMFTTSHADTDLRRSRELGASAYLIKPLGYAEYLLLMQGFVERWLKSPVA